MGMCVPVPLFLGFRRCSKITATDCTGQKAQPTLVEIDKPRCGQLFSHSSLIGEFPLSGLGTSVRYVQTLKAY